VVATAAVVVGCNGRSSGGELGVAGNVVGVAVVVVVVAVEVVTGTVDVAGEVP
jgi:hypothetical protein